MSVAMALTAVGTVLAAKSAIEGIQEGNLLKAVVGGVGAYYGMTGLQTGAAAASTNAAGAATGNATIDAATNTALQSGTEQAITAGTNAAASATANGATGASGIAGGVNAGVGGTMQSATSSTLAGLGEQAVSSPSLLGTLKDFGSSASTWVNENPMAASGVMQMGGGLLQGYAQGSQHDDEMKALEESRRRRQLTGNTSFMNNQVFNPATGRFEGVA